MLSLCKSCKKEISQNFLNFCGYCGKQLHHFPNPPPKYTSKFPPQIPPNITFSKFIIKEIPKKEVIKHG